MFIVSGLHSVARWGQFSITLPVVSEKVMKIFAWVYSLLKQSLYFAWGGYDLSQVKAEKVEQKQNNRKAAGYLLLLSGILGVVHDVLKLSMQAPPVWKIVLLSSASFFFFLSSCLYLERSINKWVQAGPGETKIKVSAVLGIVSSLAYMGVSFLGIFGVQSIVLAIISASAMTLGFVQLFL